MDDIEGEEAADGTVSSDSEAEQDNSAEYTEQLPPERRHVSSCNEDGRRCGDTPRHFWLTDVQLPLSMLLLLLLTQLLPLRGEGEESLSCRHRGCSVAAPSIDSEVQAPGFGLLPGWTR